MVLEDEFPDPPWKKYYIGSAGPFYFDATAEYLDGVVDELGSPLLQKGFFTDGNLRVGTAPVEDKDVLRKVDVVGGLSDVTIPAGYSLIFKGIPPIPDCKLVYTGGMLVIFIGTVVVARFRLTS